MKKIFKKQKLIDDFRINGSLFTYLPATVTVNGLENEMSGYCRFKGRKWGKGRKQGKPRDPKGREGLPLLETPHF